MAAAVAAAAAAAGSSNVEFIRARSDKREYRRVVLANALEILIISDPDTDKVRPRLRPPPFALLCSSLAGRGAAIATNARGPKAYRSSVCAIDLVANLSLLLALLRRRRAWRSRWARSATRRDSRASRTSSVSSLLHSSPQSTPSARSSRFARFQRFGFSFDSLRARADRISNRIRVDSWSEDLV
jgi:hypothetical protein